MIVVYGVYAGITCGILGAMIWLFAARRVDTDRKFDEMMRKAEQQLLHDSLISACSGDTYKVGLRHKSWIELRIRKYRDWC